MMMPKRAALACFLLLVAESSASLWSSSNTKVVTSASEEHPQQHRRLVLPEGKAGRKEGVSLKPHVVGKAGAAAEGRQQKTPDNKKAAKEKNNAKEKKKNGKNKPEKNKARAGNPTLLGRRIGGAFGQQAHKNGAVATKDAVEMTKKALGTVKPVQNVINGKRTFAGQAVNKKTVGHTKPQRAQGDKKAALGGGGGGGGAGIQRSAPTLQHNKGTVGQEGNVKFKPTKKAALEGGDDLGRNFDAKKVMKEDKIKPTKQEGLGRKNNAGGTKKNKQQKKAGLGRAADDAKKPKKKANAVQRTFKDGDIKYKPVKPQTRRTLEETNDGKPKRRLGVWSARNGAGSGSTSPFSTGHLRYSSNSNSDTNTDTATTESTVTSSSTPNIGEYYSGLDPSDVYAKFFNQDEDEDEDEEEEEEEAELYETNGMVTSFYKTAAEAEQQTTPVEELVAEDGDTAEVYEDDRKSLTPFAGNDDFFNDGEADDEEDGDNEAQDEEEGAEEFGAYAVASQQEEPTDGFGSYGLTSQQQEETASITDASMVTSEVDEDNNQMYSEFVTAKPVFVQTKGTVNLSAREEDVFDSLEPLMSKHLLNVFGEGVVEEYTLTINYLLKDNSKVSLRATTDQPTHINHMVVLAVLHIQNEDYDTVAAVNAETASQAVSSFFAETNPDVHTFLRVLNAKGLFTKQIAAQNTPFTYKAIPTEHSFANVLPYADDDSLSQEGTGAVMGDGSESLHETNAWGHKAGDVVKKFTNSDNVQTAIIAVSVSLCVVVLLMAGCILHAQQSRLKLMRASQSLLSSASSMSSGAYEYCQDKVNRGYNVVGNSGASVCSSVESWINKRKPQSTRSSSYVQPAAIQRRNRRGRKGVALDEPLDGRSREGDLSDEEVGTVDDIDIDAQPYTDDRTIESEDRMSVARSKLVAEEFQDEGHSRTSSQRSRRGLGPKYVKIKMDPIKPDSSALIPRRSIRDEDRKKKKSKSPGRGKKQEASPFKDGPDMLAATSFDMSAADTAHSELTTDEFQYRQRWQNEAEDQAKSASSSKRENRLVVIRQDPEMSPRPYDYF